MCNSNRVHVASISSMTRWEINLDKTFEEETVVQEHNLQTFLGQNTEIYNTNLT
jgi:hypothetical protein